MKGVSAFTGRQYYYEQHRRQHNESQHYQQTLNPETGPDCIDDSHHLYLRTTFDPDSGQPGADQPYQSGDHDQHLCIRF